MPGTDVNQLVRVARTLPAATPDGTAPVGNPRAGKYLEQYVMSMIGTKHVLADEGSYFTASMTPGQTALAYGIQASFSDIAGFIAIQNGDVANGKRIYLDYVKFSLSVAPASSTSALLAVKIDTANRTPSANFSLQTPNNVNMDSAVASIAKVWFPTGGTLTLPTVGGSARVVTGNLNLRAVLPTVADEYVIQFGGTDLSQMENAAVATATIVKKQVNAPPVIIGGTDFGLLHLWFPSNATTAASFSNIEVGWWER